MKNRTLAESSELLRIALPLMAQHKIPVTPDNYSVLYEYVAGDNQALKERIDQLLKKKKPITEEVLDSLRENYLGGAANIKSSEDSQAKLLQISSQVEKVLRSAHNDASTYEESLEGYQEQISDGLTIEQLNDFVSDIASSTSTMGQSNKELLNTLEESKREAQKLRVELSKAKKEAQTDPLTSLANRAAFAQRIEYMEKHSELAEGEHCLLIADIDKFKLVNDTYGHVFGDKVIKAIAKILMDNTKGKDLAARFGGEEFVVLLPETGIQGAQVVAEKIRRTMEKARIKNPVTGEVLDKITVSIGVTRMVVGDSIEKSISDADSALYDAKNSGRNKVIVYIEEESENNNKIEKTA